MLNIDTNQRSSIQINHNQQGKKRDKGQRRQRQRKSLSGAIKERLSIIVLNNYILNDY